MTKLNIEDMQELLRPKCDMVLRKYSRSCDGIFFNDRQKCPNCGHINEDLTVSEDGPIVVDECKCSTYYCRTCDQYRGMVMQHPLPTCRGYMIFTGKEETFTGYSNQKLLLDLGLWNDVENND